MIALDLFAGTGWGVACQRLGIEELGVEIMPEAVATRDANGMKTVYRDVWAGLDGSEIIPDHTLQIASPPCQTYSMAGHGRGRAALDDVYQAIWTGAYTDYLKLQDFVETHDEKTVLVLAPLAYAFKTFPEFIAWEQVPTVLPVWEACADVLREIGYSVVTGVLQAEQYGVPQTRKRAVLVARRDGKPARLPIPTHSRYNTRNPEQFELGVLPWVSMADALGYGGFNIQKRMGSGMVERYGTRPGRTSEQPAFTVRASAGGMEPGGFVFVQNNKMSHQAIRNQDQPAPTITAGHDSGNRGFIQGEVFTIATPEQVALLQSYPAFEWKGSKTKQFLQIGNAVPPLLAQAILREITG